MEDGYPSGSATGANTRNNNPQPHLRTTSHVTLVAEPASHGLVSSAISNSEPESGRAFRVPVTRRENNLPDSAQSGERTEPRQRRGREKTGSGGNKW